ncbi:MAG: 4Fe-4S binding protein [Bacillota bacterium]
MFNLEHLLKVLDPEPVLIDHQVCLAARHRRATCRACIEVCPEGALRLEEGKVVVDSAKCSRCGLCAGACPTASITIRGIDDAAVAGAAQLHCSRAQGLGVQVPCLGYLTVDHLLAIGLRHDLVELTRGDCASCQWQSGGAMTERTVETARQTLGAIGSEHTLRLVGRVAGEAGDRAISRRDLFNLWRVESVQVARQFAPEKEVNHAKLPAKLPARRRRWLRQANPDRAQPGATMPTGPWKGRVVSEACNGCSICVSFCPTGAFAQRETEGDWLLTHQPAACVACNTCVALCPTRAVSEEPLPAVRMLQGEVRTVVRLSTLRCRTCRKEFKGRPDESQCPQCRSVLGMLKI